jgi:hypothetical protein
MLESLEVIEGICQLRLRGECSLADVVERIKRAIAYCRGRHMTKLLVVGTDLVGVAVPSLVDRFLMAEEWAQAAESMVVVVLVARAEYIHPEKFAVRVASDFGLTLDVYTSEADALKWLMSVAEPG